MNSQDTYILGITSATPAFVGGEPELKRRSKWVKDEWGRWVFHKVTVSSITDKEGRVLVQERTEVQKIINPEYDSTKQYVPRSKRPEWGCCWSIGSTSRP